MNYLCRFIRSQKLKYRRRVWLKKKEARLKRRKESGKSTVSVIAGTNAYTNSSMSLNKYDEADDDDNNTSEDKDPSLNVYSNQDNFFSPEFLPPRKEFFLYTIDEHETFANKIFMARKKTSLGANSTISKSDTNLSILR